MTHLFVMNRGSDIPDEPDGEKPLNIGNADVVYSDAIPREIQYAALGHLHRYHDAGSHQPVIYSGSPLAYSFSEAGQQKYVAIIDVEPGKSAEVEQTTLKAGKPLKRESFKNVDRAVDWLQENKEALVELTLETDDYLKAEERKQLYQAHDGIIHLIPKVKNAGITSNTNSQINLNQNIEDLFKDYFKFKNDGQVPNEELMNLFSEIQNS